MQENFKFKPHLFVLGLLKESHVNMGRQLLAECLVGEENERIIKLRLSRLVNYSTLPLFQKKDVFELIDLLQQKGFIELKPLDSKSYIKVLAITKKGEEELQNPKADLKQKKSFEGYYSAIEKVTDDDRKIFSSLGNSLDGLSDEQKKAVICDSKKILCIAGAGSGKTKVLTNRVWYLSTLKGVSQSKILAITFTRKARQEMIERLAKLIPNNTITIETFNSFCEKILKENEEKIYGKETKVIDYGLKIRLIMKVLDELKLPVDILLSDYYTDKKLFSSDKKTLFFGFVNDIFSVLDYQRNNHIEDEKLFSLIKNYYSSILGTDIVNILKKIEEHKETSGLRDYTDQLTHVIEYFRKAENNIPRYDHILIDEYQDINSLQFELISLLNCENVFAVGDPRQSIYGWRGSKVEYILDFEVNYPNAKILGLNTNYRSSKKIVEVCNSIISTMKLPELISSNSLANGVSIVKHEDEDAECIFVAQSIMSLDTPRNNIFVLARTNKQIEKLAEYMENANIRFLKRTIEEMNTNRSPAEDEVTLSTIHAIKGLEAECVYLIGASAKNHPCKAQEHPLLEAVKTNESYDKFAEELRLMYVALSRAKSKLIINYSGTLSSYFDDATSKIISGNKRSEPSVKEKLYKINKGTSSLHESLREFRRDESVRLSIAPYQVFNDKTLDELCEVMPTSFFDLENINGFGPYKVKKWGEKIIKIIMENS